MQEADVTIRFPNLSSKQKEHLYKAATQLSKAGITFDSGVGGEENDWEFDWSLSGANVLFRRFKGE